MKNHKFKRIVEILKAFVVYVKMYAKFDDCAAKDEDAYAEEIYNGRVSFSSKSVDDAITLHCKNISYIQEDLNNSISIFTKDDLRYCIFFDKPKELQFVINTSKELGEI